MTPVYLGRSHYCGPGCFDRTGDQDWSKDGIGGVNEADVRVGQSLPTKIQYPTGGEFAVQLRSSYNSSHPVTRLHTLTFTSYHLPATYL